MNKPSLETVIASRYGVSALECDANTIEWAAAHFAQTAGVPAAAKAWRRLNARRHKLGRYTRIPAWGTPFFAAYFDK